LHSTYLTQLLLLLVFAIIIIIIIILCGPYLKLALINRENLIICVTLTDMIDLENYANIARNIGALYVR